MKAVVVLTPPHYPGKGGQEGVWFGRMFRGAMLWIKLTAAAACAPLIVVGDANGGEDLIAFKEYAMSEHGMRDADVHLCPNGDADNKAVKNTRGDARATVRLLLEDPRFKDVDELHVVTCWYHVPRAKLAFELAWQELCQDDRTLTVRIAAVWERAPRPHKLLLFGKERDLPEPFGRVLAVLNEARGWRDYRKRRPQRTRGGGHVGKPDFRG